LPHRVGLFELQWLCHAKCLSFYKLKPLAAFINIPCLLWVTFAKVPNAALFFLNRN
jgi:tryptophan-rich sensory protein